MIDVLITGIGGKMGEAVRTILENDNKARVVCGVDLHAPENCKVPVYKSFAEIKEKVDVIVDFSSPAVVTEELEWAVKNKVPAVLAATGYTADDIEYIDGCSEKIAIFRTANFSLGVNLLVKLVNQAAKTLGENFDIEIIERHHNKKADAYACRQRKQSFRQQ